MSDEFLIQIGKITIQYQWLEYHIKWILEHFVNKKEGKVVEIVTAGMNFSQLLQVLKSLNDNFEKSEELNSLIKKAKLVSNKRNQIMHSIWLVDLVSGKVEREKISLKNGKQRFAVSLEELKIIVNELHDLVSKFYNFNYQLMKP